jgi:hypothetical protein
MASWTKHPILKLPTKGQLSKLLEEKGAQAVHEVWKAREDAIKLSNENPLYHGFTLEGWVYADEMLQHYDTLMCFGGNRCLAGEQLIYDPVKQKSLRVDEIEGDFYVWAWDCHTKEKVVASAEKPYQKPSEMLYDVTLSNGRSLACSAGHRIATPFGWRSLSSFSVGQLLFSHRSTGNSFFSRLCGQVASVFSPQKSKMGRILLAWLQDALCLKQTLQDFRGDCRSSSRFYDEQLLSDLGFDQALAPSPIYAPRRMECAFDDLGDLGSISPRSHQRLSSFLLSILCAVPRYAAHFAAWLSYTSSLAYSLPPLRKTTQNFLQRNCKSLVTSFLRLSSWIVYSCLSVYLVLVSYIAKLTGKVWVVKVNDKQVDTVWDFTVEGHFTYMIDDVPQKNSGKTEFGARAVVKAAIENPNSIIVCFAQDNDASIRIQQAAIYRYLPPEFKEKQKSQLEYVNYTVKNGFTGYSLILPNGSQIRFHTYSQFISNRSKFEGLELGSHDPTWENIGLWCDEYLEDGDLIKTMRFRLATRNAKMILTFTPIDGYTPFVAEFLKDAETKKTRPAELLNGQEVPVMQYSASKDAGIVYFHSEFNPFGGYERIAKELRHSPREEILTRAYGIPVKSMATIFPLFSTNVHVIEAIPKITAETHTVYQVIDPAGARNFFCIWAAVDKDENVTILREWPDRGTHGEWGVFGDPKWKFGPASKKLGYAIKTDSDIYSYPKLFESIEKELGVEVFERIGDSRFMAAEHDEQDMFTDFADKGMYIVPSDGRTEDSGIQLIDQWFAYNPNIEIDSINKPKIHIHESCGNLIYSLINYTPDGKKAEPLKDPIDCLRYLRTANNGEGPMHFNKIGTTRKGKGGY